MVNRKKADRARQFLPFDALKGYKEAIVEKQRVIVSKKDLSEDDAKILDYKLNQVDVGMMINVIYYCENNYVLLEGMVSKIDKDTTAHVPSSLRHNIAYLPYLSGSQRRWSQE